jgi:hypothetical protein
VALTWKQVPGAVRYHVMGRNTVASPQTWRELLAIDAPDPVVHPSVVATGVNPWGAQLGTGGYPWSFGNHIEIAYTSEDAQGTLSDVSAFLESSDGFPGVLTEIEIDRPDLPVPFDPRTERGATFRKTIRLSFSEPMVATAPPVLAPQSANVTIRNVDATAWGNDAATPSITALSAASHAFLALRLTVKGACTELLVDRGTGDILLPVRDTSFFTVDAGARLLFLDGLTGDLLGEAVDVAAVDPSLGRLTLGGPLVLPVGSSGLPAGALACALSGPGAVVSQLVSSTGAFASVADASPFFVGEQVAVFEPSAGGTMAIHDLRTVKGVDTVAQVLLLSAPLSPGHTAASVVVPLNGLGGEVALRPSVSLSLQRDAGGGTGAELFLSAPAGIMVGDTVLVDADGDLETTPDQAQAVVSQVKLAPQGSALVYSIVLDLPASLTLLHGRSKVIGLGDCFQVSGTRDTSAAEFTPLDPHRDQFTADGMLL